MLNRGDYRIRNSKKTEDDIDLDFEEHLKISTHIQGPKRQNSAAVVRRHNQSGQHSRVKQSRVGSGFGSGIGSRVGRVLRMSKTAKDKNVVTDIEFNNVRWISIVSAYDSKRLRHVTVSKQSCQTFLKKYGYDLKKDPAAMAYFRDIKKHFYSWLSKINETFVNVLDQFLTINDRSPLNSLQKVGPTLQEIRSDTAMMEQKLQSCLRIYENNDFRKLSQRFKGFFVFSSSLQELIAIIFQSKQRIDDLFYQLQNGEDVDRKIQKIKKQGMKETKKLVYHDSKYSPSLCDKIMEKVSLAINDMTTRSLDLFHRFQGAKELITKIRKILNDAHKRLTIKEIKKFSQIFHQVLQQTAKFQDFVEHFDSESDFVSEQLRQKIHLCRQDLLQKKKAVGQMQVIFVGTVISETITVLHQNYSINNALNQQQLQYQQHNHLLQAITDIMLDQTKRTVTEGLIKQNRTAFSRLQEDLQKIRRSLKKNQNGLVIDTEEGQVTAMECYKLTKDYKQKVKNLVKKHEEALKNLQAKVKELRIPTIQQDLQVQFLSKLVSVSEGVNSRQRQNSLIHEKGFQQPKGDISVSAHQVQQVHNILQSFAVSRGKIVQLNEQNPLVFIVKQIRTQNCLYLECSFLLNVFKIISQASQKNLIQVLGNTSEINVKRKNQLEKLPLYKQTKLYRNILQRLYCLILIKGLKKNAIKEIDDSKLIHFPENQFQTKEMENQSKYRTLIINTLTDEASFIRNKLKLNLEILKDLIGGKRLIQKLNLNQNGQFIALTDTLSTFSSQMFKLCLLSNKPQGIASQARRISLQLTKCFKTRSTNIDNLEKQIDLQYHDAILRVRKEIIHYKNINEKAINSCQTIAKSQDNDPLNTLSTITHTIVEYIRQTNQIVYFALNQFRQPIWIGPYQQAKQGIAKEIDLIGYQRGSFVDSYANQVPKAYKKVKQTVIPKQNNSESKEKNDTKQSKQKDAKIIVKDRAHERQAMDEQIDIIESDNQMKQEMNEDIPDVEDQMIQQMEGGMEENIAEDEMGEQIADDLVQDVKQQSMEQNMGEQIPDDQVQIIKPKMNKVIQKKQNEKPVKKQEQEIPKKSVYEVIPFFRQFQQIRELIQKIKSTEKQFWKEYVDFQEIEDYFHRLQDLRDRNNFVKSLENSFSMFLGTRFGSKLGELVKNLDRLKTMKGQILSFGQKNWQQFFKILDTVQRNYSVLLNSSSQVVRIFTYNGDNSEFKMYNCKKCVENYLENNFKSSYFSLQNFDMEGYISNCLKVQTQQLINGDEVSFHYIVKYTAKSLDSLPGTDICDKLEHIAQIESRYSKKMETGLNLSLLCLQFWIKAIQSSSEDCYKPDYTILNGYLKQLSKLQKKQWIGHYLIDFNKSMNALKANIKAHKNGVDNLVFKIDSSNIFQCLQQLSKLYSNVTVQKLLYVDNQNKKNLVYFERNNEAQGIFVQTTFSLLVKQLFNFKKSKEPEISLKKQYFIDQIQKLLLADHNNQQTLGFLMKLLNILKIEHFFTKKPQLLFKNNMQTLVLYILKGLGVKNVSQIKYQQLISDLFDKKQDCFSHQLILKINKNATMLNQQNITLIRKNLKQIEQQLDKSKQKLRNLIKQTDMSNVLIDFLLSRSSENNLIKSLQLYNAQLIQIKNKTDKSLNNREENIMLYVHSFRTSVQKACGQINQQMIEIKPMIIDSKKLSNTSLIIEAVSNFFSQIKKWAKTINLSQQFTSYSVIEGQNHWIFHLQFNVLKRQNKGKEILQNLIDKNWLKNQDWKKNWSFIFERYIQKNVTIKRESKENEVLYNFQVALREILTDIRLDLAQPKDIIEFAKLYNKHRFNQSQQIIDLLLKFHSKIMERLLLKRKLMQLGKYAQFNNFNGLNTLELPTKLFDCIKQNNNISQADLDIIISMTGELKEKETDLTSFIKWYKMFPQSKLDCHYMQLRSSIGVPITLLPILKIQKDKSKNNEQIGRLLQDIQLPSTFYTKLEGGVHVVFMQPEIVQCIMRDKQGFLVNDKQFEGFQPDIPDNQILILLIQQVNIEQSILQIAQLAIKTSSRVLISENMTKVDIVCGIWRIGREDYFEIKAKHITDKNEEMGAIRKKCRGLASPQQKFKDVKVGQQLILMVLGEWLKEQLKKSERKKAQREKAELQRLRQQEQQKRQAEQFLNNMYEQLEKESVPVIHMSLKDIQTKKQLFLEKPDVTFSGFFKKTSEKTTKIIERLQQNKSREQITRLSTITKTYLKALDEELIKNYEIEARIKAAANLNFKKIEQQRSKKQKQIKVNKQQQAKFFQEVEKIIAEHKLEEKCRYKSFYIPKEPKQKQQKVETSKHKQNLENTRSAKTLSRYLGNEPVSEKINSKDVDVVQLILEHKNLEDEKVESFLIEWLEYQEPKDVDYFRCLLAQFSKLPIEQIKSLSKFH